MDPLAVYQITREAVDRAAGGRGPALIEMYTYRYGPHSTYDGTPVYRTDAEEASWRARDPITRMGNFLERRGLWETGEELRMREDLSAELERAVTELEARLGVTRDYSPRHLFARIPTVLVDQLHREQQDLGEPLTAVPSDEIWTIGPVGRIRWRYRGRLAAPVVIRLPVGTGMIVAFGKARALVQLRDGNPVEVPTLTVCGTFDHRIIDGGSSGRFLAQLKDHIEVPDLDGRT